MRVLLTGVPGWLGNRFLEILAQGFDGKGPVNDWDIRCLVLPGESDDTLKACVGSKHIEIVRGDVTNKDSLKDVFRGVDVVFHMVGLIHPKKIQHLYDINSTGTFNVISESYEQGVKRFVYISSNSVGGVNKKRDKLMIESDEPNPYLNYGKSKYYAECIVNHFNQSKKMETVILRPCWFYGPHQPARQSRFFKMIQSGSPIIFGDGFNFRSLSYVDNTAQAMIKAASVPQAAGQTYWVADARPYTSFEIYKTVSEILEVKNFKPRFVPSIVSSGFLLADRMLQAVGSYITEVHVAGEMDKDIACCIDKARHELGYQPVIELREGMIRSIEWCKKHKLF